MNQIITQLKRVIVIQLTKKEINRTLNKNKANKKFLNALEIKDLQKVNIQEGQKNFDELIKFFSK